MNYKQYLLSLSSGNIAPLTKMMGSNYVNIDTNIDALLNLTLESVIASRYRIFVVNADDTIQSELPIEDILQGGSFSENYQNGQRCSLSLTLFNQSGKYTPNINKLWVGTKLRLDAGLEQQDGAIVWCQKGIFVITSTQPSYSAENKTVSISAGDKFAELEGGVGILQDTYEIPSGSRILPLVRELLGIQRGDGSPIDSQEPYFHPSLAQKVTQAKISKNAGETVGSIMLELANHMSAEVFYNSQGRLCFLPLDAVSDDNDKPVLFNYIADEGHLTELNFSLDYNNIINRIILIGATVNGGVVRAVASNDDVFSPLSVQRIGARTSVVNESGIKTKIVAEENAKYQLRKQLVLKSSVNLNVPYNPIFGVNNLVMITDDFYQLVKQYFLIQSISFGLDYSGTMSMTVSNLNNLPFITSYKSGVEEEDDDYDIAGLISYKIIANITNGSASGTKWILQGGERTINIVPDQGRVYPSSVNVVGCEYTYDSNSGNILLTNPTTNIRIVATCLYPVLPDPVIQLTWSNYHSTILVKVTNPSGSPANVEMFYEYEYDTQTGTVSGQSQFASEVAPGSYATFYINQNNTTGPVESGYLTISFDGSPGTPVQPSNKTISLTPKNITTTVSHGSVMSGPDTKIWPQDSAYIYIQPASNYSLPNNVTVSGSGYDWDSTYSTNIGLLELFDATSDVTVSVTCFYNPPTYSLTFNVGTGVSSYLYSLYTYDDYQGPFNTNKTITGILGGSDYYFYIIPSSGYVTNYTSSDACVGEITTQSVTENLANYVFHTYSYTTGSKTGISSLTTYRTNSSYNQATIGALSSSDTIYAGDHIYFAATASSGYSVSTSYYDSNHTLTVTEDVVAIDYISVTQLTLDAPVIDLTGAILSWTSVTNATAYSIRCAGVEVATSANLSIDLSTIFSEDGEYAMTVVATASGYRESNPSNSKTYLISVAPIYGVSGLYGSGISLTRTDDAVGKTFAINSSSGAISSDFNDLFPWNEATVETINGNKFIHMPDMWFRVGKDTSNRITDVAVSKQQGATGNWFKADSFYYSCYGGSLSSGKLASVSGATRLATQTRAAFRSYAAANGSGYFQEDLYHRTVLTFLWWIEWATKKSDTIMTGRIGGSGTSGGSSMRPTGGTDAVTTASGYETAYAQMRYHYIEDFVGNLLEFVDGSVGTGSSGGAQYVTADPTKYGDTSANHNTLAFNSPTTSGKCLAAMGWDDNNPFLCLPKETVSDSNYSTYFCDYAQTSNKSVLCCGAHWYNNNANFGVSYFGRYAASYSYNYIGGRLLYKQMQMYPVSITNNHCTVSGPSYLGTYSDSTAEYTITPSSGYTLPTSAPTITGATLVSYNSTTGKLVIRTATANVSFTVTCPPAVQTYNVTITYDPYHGDGSAFTCADIYDGEDSSGSYKGRVDAGNTSKTVTCSTGWIFIEIRNIDYGSGVGTTSGGVTLDDNGGSYALYRVTGNGSITGVYGTTCYIKGTPITLADGTHKNVEDITYDDNLLVWDFDNGEFSSAKPLWLQKSKKSLEYNHLEFSDGSELNTVNQHRIFNKEAGKFTYPMTDDTPIGTTTLNDKGEFVTLISKEIIKEEVEYYNIITDYHINCFAGHILTSCRMSNLYPIVDMKYVREEREAIKYNVPEKWYTGLRLAEQPAWVITSNNAYDFGDRSYEDYINRLIKDEK